jgi:hypothetical protein
MDDITQSAEYRLIRDIYGQTRARRSGVLYMKHIDDGLAVLRWLDADPLAARAFCLHPLVQRDAELSAHLERLAVIDGHTVALAMAYRHVANSYLSHHEEREPAAIELGPLAPVSDMLRADKVQNYKDFLRYHRHTHPRAEILDRYFRTWLERLDITPARFAALCDALDALAP